VRNRLFKRVADECDWKEIEEILSGPTATVSGDDDVGAAKILRESALADSRPVMKGGVISGVFLTAKEIDDLALLPSREALLGMAVGTIAAPMTGLVGVMNQKLLTLLNVLKAAEDKKKVD
jgi:large subunit ribosomal protein L10